MKNIDPDIIAALRSVAADGDSQRLLNVKARHERHNQQVFETQMQLLSDEVERVVPRDHPLFALVLLLTVLRKVTRDAPEVVSDLEF